MTDTTESRDRILRAMTRDGAFRAVTVRASDTARWVAESQGVEGVTARLLGELVVGAAMIRETMAPDRRVQAILASGDDREEGGDGGNLVADSHPGGMTRGLAWLPEGVDALKLGPASVIQVVRTLPGGRLQQSVASAGTTGGVSGALMSYMQASEQVVSMLAVSCTVAGDRVVSAGGYMIQLLPEVAEGPLAVMTERLEDFRKIDDFVLEHDGDPALLLGELFYGYEHTLLSESPIYGGCNCSTERVVGALATLATAELDLMVGRGEPVDLDCHYCGTRYQVSPEQLRALLDQS